MWMEKFLRKTSGQIAIFGDDHRKNQIVFKAQGWGQIIHTPVPEVHTLSLQIPLFLFELSINYIDDLPSKQYQTVSI